MFEPFLLRWLEENDELSMTFVENAIDTDKKNGFEKNSEAARFSSSVVDIFCSLMQSLDIVKKLELPDPDVESRLISRFSQTIVKVLHHYCKRMEVIFEKVSSCTLVACILMNNIQQLRVELQKVYEAIGLEKMDAETHERFKQLQSYLAQCLDNLAVQYGTSVAEKIEECCKLINSSLIRVKGTVNLVSDQDRQQLEKEADEVMHSLLIFLQDR
jgi:protein unc-13